MDFVSFFETPLSPSERYSLVVGVAMGAAISVLLFLIDKLFSDWWHRLPFGWGKHKARFAGNAERLYALKGVGGEDGSLRDLSFLFPAPESHDGVQFSLENVLLRTKWNDEAQLTATLRWKTPTQEWSARLVGSGRYFPKKRDELSGYVYVVCRCVGEGKPGNLKERWQCAYALRSRTDRSGVWDGIWILFDSDHPDRGKIGTLHLMPKE